MSIIDTISLGYGLVNRRPWLMLVPVLLDLFFWLGPRLSARAPLEAFINQVATQETANAEFVEQVRQMATQLDLFTLLAVLIPSLVPAIEPASLPFAGNRSVFDITEPATVVLISLGLLLLGLGLMALYLTPMAQAVRTGRTDLEHLGGSVWRSWMRLLLLIGLLIAGILAVTLPLSIIAALVSLAGVNIILLLVMLLQIAAVWLLIYLYFVPEAIVVSEVGPLRAIRNSIAVVRHNFWSALGLIALTLLITAGLAVVFEAVAANPIGMPLAIAAHAYIGSGLVAASMIFYRDRLARSQQQQPSAVNQVGPGARR